MEDNSNSKEIFRNNIHDYQILGSSQEQDYDDLIFLAASICNVETACLGILDNHQIWFKSKTGFKIEKIDLDNSFSGATLKSEEEIIFINYSDNPELFQKASGHYKNNFRFYCGVSIVNTRGHKLGVLEVLDLEERKLEDFQIKSLKILASQIMKLLEFRKQNNKFLQIQNKLKQKYQELEKFASLVSHDIKSPLANIISLTELLREENQDKLDDETIQYLNYLVESSYSLRNYVDGILNFYRSEHILDKANENVDLHQMLKEIANLYEVSDDVNIEFPAKATLKNINKAALYQILLNLVSNSLKYNNKKVREVEINFNKSEYFYHFEVIDNGEGFPIENSERIFELFNTLDVNDRNGNPGSGIGLATVKKLVTSLGGEIKVDSEPGKGSKFSFSIARH